MSDTDKNIDQVLSSEPVFPQFSDSKNADIINEFLQWRTTAQQLLGTRTDEEDD